MPDAPTPIPEDVRDENVYKCKCGKPASPVPHTCPFRIEIHDEDLKCWCCGECEYDCAMEV